VWPLSLKEQAEADEARARADLAEQDAGLSFRYVMKERRGMTDPDIDELVRQKQEETASKATLGDALVEDAMQRFGKGV